jgi:hypothetical protein
MAPYRPIGVRLIIPSGRAPRAGVGPAGSAAADKKNERAEFADIPEHLNAY